MDKKEKIEVSIIGGAEGDCLCIGDTRVAGPKPWAGGELIKKWVVDIERIKEAIWGKGPIV